MKMYVARGYCKTCTKWDSARGSSEEDAVLLLNHNHNCGRPDFHDIRLSEERIDDEIVVKKTSRR